MNQKHSLPKQQQTIMTWSWFKSMSDQVTQRIISFYLWILERALFFLLFFLRLRIKRNFRERQQTYLIWPTTDSALMIKTPCHWPTQIQWLAKEWECTESFTKHPIDTDSRLAWICKRQSSTTHCSFLFTLKLEGWL